MIHNDKDIYENVLADVDKAIAGLPDTQESDEVGRIKGPQGLKAKMLMQKGAIWPPPSLS